MVQGRGRPLGQKGGGDVGVSVINETVGVSVERGHPNERENKTLYYPQYHAAPGPGPRAPGVVPLYATPHRPTAAARALHGGRRHGHLPAPTPNQLPALNPTWGVSIFLPHFVVSIWILVFSL